METIKNVLASYAVYPLKIEKVTDTVFRIEDGQHVYALKKSSLTKQSIANWENVFRQAHAQNVPGVLSVYLTKQHYLYAESNNTIYYLTPWIEASRQSIERLYQLVANVHAKTKQSHPVEMEKTHNQFNTYKRHCESAQKRLLNYVEQFEKKRYMSPFELLVCMQFRDLESGVKEALKRVDQFLEEQTEQSTWNYSLCHGNLMSSHILNADYTYLINWEGAHYGSPIQDLVHLFKQEVIEYDAPTESFIALFTTYMMENELTKGELYLLTVYLLDSTDYVALVENYINDTSSEDMIGQIKSLQHAYRRLVFGLHWSNYVEKEYDTIALDDLES